MLRYDETLHAFVPKQKHAMHGVAMWENLNEAIDDAIEWANKEKIPYFNFKHIETNLQSLEPFDYLTSQDNERFFYHVADMLEDVLHDAERDFEPTYPGDEFCPISIIEEAHHEAKFRFNLTDGSKTVDEFFEDYSMGNAFWEWS